jgi:hypothetical protein
MENNTQIYRNSPKGYNNDNQYMDRREEVYNPHPPTSNKVSGTYYSIKKEANTFEIINIIKKIISPIMYFTYQEKIYKISELPMKTLYKDINKKLIPDEKLFVSTQKTFLDEHLDKSEEERMKLREEERRLGINRDQEINPGYSTTLTPSPGREPRSGSYFVSRSPQSYGLTDIKFKDLLLDQQKIQQILFYYFILKFNIEAKKSNYDMPQHPWTNYYITDYQLIRIQYNNTLNIYYYTFVVEIFRQNKHNGYAIYLDMYYRPEKTQIWISRALLIGVISQDELTFKKLGYFNKNENSLPFSDINQADSILDKIYDKMKNYEYRTENIKSISHTILTRDFDLHAGRKCYKPGNEGYPDAQTSNACLSVDPNINKTGVWDRECMTNEECPFYKANKNYPNNFGGCIEGKCQLPVGMNSIGFKHYTKDKPLCYNCKLKKEIMLPDGTLTIQDSDCSGIECNKCCDIQNNKNIYPNLKSPDFVFDNDHTEREKYSRLLELNGLGVSNLIMQ